MNSTDTAAGPHPTASVLASPARQGTAALTLGAIGVVYGDIGTSPLYTMKEVFAPATGVPLDAPHLIGAVSTILWALMIVVTLKYVILVLRADNHGEGGVFALAALAAGAVREQPRLRTALLVLGVLGAALFYGDSLLTPAISVLGAMEGLQVVAPSLADAIVPASVVILIVLFVVQRRGTASVGRWFGPVITVWFVVLAITGIAQILRAPQILAALNPLHAITFLAERGPGLLLTVGAVVLAITGAEALYADMGHFGRRPIRLAWSGLVLPALALNYMGQGALLIAEPDALENPFYRMFPQAMLVPALVLATLAAIIASQAVISGAYSVTRQAVQLGFLPRMVVRHTSAGEAGQIYMPRVNVLLLVGVVAVVLAFRSSSALASAYGIAVTLTMLITTVLTWVVVRRAWGLHAGVAAGATAVFGAIDLLLVAGCSAKFLDGGWFTVALGLVMTALMLVWWRGRRLLLEQLRTDAIPLADFTSTMDAPLPRARRTAVYLVAEPGVVPQALLHNLKHNQVLHERNVVLSVRFVEQPWVDDVRRAQVTALPHGFWQVVLDCGFMESPDVPRALARVSLGDGVTIDPFETSYFLSRETVVPKPRAGLARWADRLYAAMSRQAGGAVGYFRLPDNAVVELGTRVQI